MDKLKHIATEVGVSENTVLRILRGQNKEVWPSAILRATQIRNLAQKIGYLPNSSARSMRRQRFDCVGLLLAAIRGRSHLPDGLFNRLHDALSERGIRLVVSKLGDDKLKSEKFVPLLLQELSCDGLLINYTNDIPSEMERLIKQYSIPSIWINAREPADCVYYDDFGAAIAVTQRLQQLGHRRIAYLDFVPLEERTHYSRIDRYEGYVQAMSSKGLTPTPREPFAGIPVSDRLEATRSLLCSPERPTAVITYDAGERLLYAAALAGLRVPQDLSIVAFGPKVQASTELPQPQSYIGRRLATAMVPAEKAADEAVRMLVEKIQNPKEILPSSIIPLEMDPGDTTGPAPTERS